MEPVLPVRATRQRKPTMKAAAADEEKASRRATRGALGKALVQQEEHKEPQEAVPAPISDHDAHEELEEASDPRKDELNEVDAPKQDEDEEVVIIEVEELMEEAAAEEAPVTYQECTNKSELQEQQVDDEKCSAPLATQEDSPVLGLVSTATEQEFEDEGADFQDGGGSSACLLDKVVFEEICDVVEEIKMTPGIRAQQAPLTAKESYADDASHESEMENFNEAPLVIEEISEVDTQDDLVSKEKEHLDIAAAQADNVDETAFLDCSGNTSHVAGEETDEDVNTEDGLVCQEEGDVGVDKVMPDMVDNFVLVDCSSDISEVEVKKAENITSEMPENPAASMVDEDVEEMPFYNCDVDKPNEVVISDSMCQVTVTDEVVQEEKGVLMTDEMLQGTAAVHDDIEDDQFETVFVQAAKVVTADKLPEQVTGFEVTVENTVLIVDEKQQSTVITIDKDVVEDHSPTDGVHANEQMEVVTTDKVPELTGTNVAVVAEEKTRPVVDEKQKSTVTIDEDIVDDHLKTDVYANEQMEVTTTDEVPELTETDDEVVEEMKTTLVVDEKQQSTVTLNGDIVDDHFETLVAHADKQKEVVATEVPEVTGTDNEIGKKTPLILDEKKQSTVTLDGDVLFDHFKTDIAGEEQKEGIVTEVPEVTGTDDQVIMEKAALVTEDIPNITHTMDECVLENHTITDFGHGNEQKKAITVDNFTEISRTEDRDAPKKNALTSNIPRELDLAEDSGQHIVPALLDHVTESLSKSIITVEPSVSVSEDTSVCKNNSEKNNIEPMTVLEDKGIKVTKNSVDLSTLSLGQLRVKLKEKLIAKKNKEAKRVALAKVDENVCRSHAKGQQQNLNLHH